MKVLKNIFRPYHYLTLKMLAFKNFNDSDTEKKSLDYNLFYNKLSFYKKHLLF